MLSIGELAGYLTLDDSKFEAGLKDAQQKFTKAGDWLKDHGKEIGAGAGAAVGAAVGFGLVKNMEIQAGRQKLRAQLGLSAGDAKKAGEVAGKLYSGDFAGSLDEANEAIANVVRNMNVKVGDVRLEGLAQKALVVANTFEQDLGGTTAAVGQMIRTGLVKDAQEGLDLITVGLQGPANKADDLMDTFNEYGTQFRKLGLSGQAAMGLLQQGLQAGARDSDVVADSLKEFSIRSQEAIETMDSKGRPQLTALGQAFNILGVDGYKMQEKIAKGGPGATKALDTVLDRLRNVKDPTTQAWTAVQLFGTQAEDMGAALYKLDPSKAVKGLGDVAGAAQKVSDQTGDTAQSRIDSYRKKVELWTASLVETDGPLGDVAAGVMAFGGQAMGALAPLGSLALAMHAQRAASAAAAAATNENTVAQGRSRIAAIASKGVQLGAAAATKAWTIAQRGLNLALSMNPIGLVVIGLVALVAALVIAYKKSETFRKIVDGAFRGVWSAIKFVWDWIKEHWPLLLSIITGPIGAAVIYVVRHWDQVKEKTLGVWKAMRDGIAAALRAIKNGVQTAVLWIVDKVLWMAEKVLKTAVAAFGWAPGIGDKLKAASAKVSEFRAGVNRELDAIRDEQVVVTVRGITRVGNNLAAVHANNASSGAGGAGRALPRAVARAAMGGGGPAFLGVTRDPHATDAFQNKAHALSTQLAETVQKELKKRAAHAAAVGATGKAGQVLPRGSYSIGMPYHGYPGHNGADYPAPTGTPVFSPWPGRVTASYDIPGASAYNNLGYASYGRVVKIAHTNGFSTLYAHLFRRMVSAGQSVSGGTQIGQVGEMGNATGPHLHFEVSRNGATFNPASLHLFDRGGVARGAGLMVKGPRPERILSPQQTESFDRLVKLLERNPGQAAPPRPIEVYTNDPVAAARETVRQMAFAGIG